MITKILCIHGFRSNGELLQKSMDSLTKKFAKYDINFEYITSPISFVDLEGDGEIEDLDGEYYYRQWWTTGRSRLFDEPKYDTLFDSIKYIYDIYSKNKYDGILGYSQGSVLTQIILYLQQYPELFEEKYKDFHFDFKFGILGSTFNISDKKISKLYDRKLNVPILNIYGSKDTLVPYNISESFSDKCDNATNYKHSGKHYIPTTKESFEIMKIFIDKNKN